MVNNMGSEVRQFMEEVVPFVGLGTGIGILSATGAYEIWIRSKSGIDRHIDTSLLADINSNRVKYQKYGAMVGLASGAAFGLYAHLELKKQRRKR